MKVVLPSLTLHIATLVLRMSVRYSTTTTSGSPTSSSSRLLSSEYLTLSQGCLFLIPNKLWSSLEGQRVARMVNEIKNTRYFFFSFLLYKTLSLTVLKRRMIWKVTRTLF